MCLCVCFPCPASLVGWLVSSRCWQCVPGCAASPAGCYSICVGSALTPTHQKGPAGDPANQRPIAFGEVLYRLYTSILNDRLVTRSEEDGLRSPVQAGFRPRQLPIHHLFALRRFSDRAILQQRLLFVSFVDLRKAYDTVQHLIWARLEAIGVSPKMLAAIKSLYASGTLSTKVGGVAAPSLVQQTRVQQGCPLSPTVFSISFDGLHGHLDRYLPHAGLQALADGFQLLCTPTMMSCFLGQLLGCRAFWTACMPGLGALHHHLLQRWRSLTSVAAALTRGMSCSTFISHSLSPLQSFTHVTCWRHPLEVCKPSSNPWVSQPVALQMRPSTLGTLWTRLDMQSIVDACQASCLQ